MEKTKNSRSPKHRNTWLAPTAAFILIASISVISYFAQSQNAEINSRAQYRQMETEAQSAIANNLDDFESASEKLANLYNSDTREYERAVAQYVSDTKFTTKFKGAAFIGFAEAGSNEIKFIQPPSENFSSGTSTDQLINTPVSQIADIDADINKAKLSGEPEVSALFIDEGLTEGQSLYTFLITPVYTDLPYDASQEQRAESFRGSIVIPISISQFLDGAQEKSTNFRVFRLLDNKNNIIATSNVNADLSELTLAKTTVDLRDRTLTIQYDQYIDNIEEVAAAQRSTLIAGLGLAIIVFLLFTMMRISEKRARKLAKDAEREVYESEARFSALIQQSSDITLVIDSNGKIQFASPSIWFTLGFSHEDIIGKNILEILGKKLTKKIAKELLVELDSGKILEPFEVEVLTKDGKTKIFECVVNDLRQDEAVGGIVCNSRDITERKKAQSEVVKAKALYENALSNAPNGVALVHQDGECFFSNDSLQTFLGKSAKELNSIRLRDCISPDDQFAFSDMWNSLEMRGSDRIIKELRFEHPDGRQRWGLISAQGVYDDDVFQYFVVQIEDTTERRSIAERLEYQAIHDPLTGLPNRLLFVDRLEVALLRSKRNGLGVAVLFLDLDRFKVVNDSLGHAAGDRLLESVAERIKASVRPNDTLARFGGDEFVILCEDITDESQTAEIAERLLKNINRPIMLEEGEVYVTASIGIARSLDGEDTPETILRDADTAMYRAKDGGRNRSEVFDERTHARAVANLETGNGMFRALAQNEFRVRYQPIVSLSSGRLSGFEALVFWQHPERGHIGPVDFIPLAEETGVIVPLGLQIFEEACHTLHRWHSFSARSKHLTMSVNLSPRQITEPTFVDEVSKILKKTKVNPARIWFEITESALMVDADSTIAMLDQLRNLGVHFEVDDFGTGFSSLSYLKKFPVDALKIDQGFVDGLGRDPEDSAIVTAVVSLSHALGLQAIAEGVETPLQMAELKTLGCEYAQGYLFARPDLAETWDDAVRSDELFTFAEEPAP